MPKIKKVTPNKITYTDGTTLTTRDGDNLLELYYSSVYDILTTKKGDASNPLTPFVKEGISKLKESSLIQLDRLVKQTAEYYAPDTLDSEFIEYRLSKRLFPWQRTVFNSTAKKITLCCGRRSGKTQADAILAINHCTTPNDNFNGFIKPRKVAIIGLTIEKTAEIFWDNLIAAADISKMPYKANNSKYLISFNNGTTVQLFGNSTKAEREKLRGTEFSLIIIDEAQSQNNLNYLLTDILGPIITGRDSTVILSGTGSLTGRGTWVDLCESPAYQHFHYTMADNPSVPSTALEDILREKGWTPDNITYQREYLALHVIDTTRTIIPKWHTIKALPDNFIADGCYVGVDYGYEDYNAFVPIVWNREGKLYCLRSIKFNHASSEDIVNKAKELEEELSKKYKVKPIFIADNSDQSISQSIFRKGINIHNAYKVDLKAQITDTKEYIVNGTIQFVEADTKEMIEEFKNLIWKWDDDNKCVVYEEDVDYYHGHVFHALRYALNTYRMKYRR